MIERYNDSEISNIWTNKNKYQTWLDVEMAVCEGWSKLKIIPKKDLDQIKAKVKLNLPKFLAIEKITKHDIVAFTRMLSLNLGKEKKWIHLGLTSSDVVDSAQNYLIKQSNAVILKRLIALQTILKKQSLKYKNQVVMGRSHGVFGEPTSLGLKFLLWYAEISRQINRFKNAAKEIEVVKISSSMGNFAHLEFEVEDYVAKKFGLGIDPISTQVTQRDRHITLFNSFANISSTLEKIATEIRHFQRSEVGEMAEGFSKNQKGSSSMPHKRNPISSENICGLSRLIRANASVSFANNVLWHERDISHSSNERIIIPDSFTLLGYTLTRLTDTITNLVVNKDHIQKNIDKCNNIFFSQRLISYIICNSNASREEVYDFIQKVTFITFEQNRDFKDILRENNIQKYLSLDKLDKLFDINYFTRHIESIYNRVFKAYEK